MKIISKQNIDQVKELGLLKEPLVAVYGSLRFGMSNCTTYLGPSIVTPNTKKEFFPNNNQTKSWMLGIVETEPKYTMYSLGGFPGVVKGGITSIILEIFQLSDNNLENKWKMLDFLEGYRGEQYSSPDIPNANFYNKESIETPWGEAKIYFLNQTRYLNTSHIVTSGDWKGHVKDLRERNKKVVQSPNEERHEI